MVHHPEMIVNGVPITLHVNDFPARIVKVKPKFRRNKLRSDPVSPNRDNGYCKRSNGDEKIDGD
jgi:hypothetical protein